MPSGAARWRAPGTLGSLVLLSVAAVALGLIWGRWVLPSYNSEVRGDILHHALMVHEQAQPELPWPGFFAGYPRASHWLTAQLLPLFDNDPYRALRGLAFTSVVLLLALQFTLLRQALPALGAVLVLALWQCLCYQTHFANPHFYHGAFFYSQGIGTVAAWLCLLVIAAPASWHGRLPATVCVGFLATFAYACHVVPGLVAFGAAGTYLLAQALRHRSLRDLAAVGLLTLIGAVLLFITGQLLYMKKASSGDGTLQVGHVWLLVLWVPTLPIALAERFRALKAGRPTSGRERLLDVLTALLLVSGFIQGACFWCWLVTGTMAPYAVKKLSFLTFPAATLLWLVWAAAWLERSSLATWVNGWRQQRPWLVNGAVVACTMLALLRMSCAPLQSAFRGPFATADTQPVEVASQLARECGRLGRCLYLDPHLPNASAFVNMAGLGHGYCASSRVASALSHQEPIALLLEGTDSFLLPASADPAAVFGVPVAWVSEGSWRRVLVRDIQQYKVVAQRAEPALAPDD